MFAISGMVIPNENLLATHGSADHLRRVEDETPIQDPSRACGKYKCDTVTSESYERRSLDPIQRVENMY